jgi:hypothetical protein
VPLPDEYVPDFEVWERRELALPVSPGQALRAAVAAPDRIVRALFRFRGLKLPRGSREL